MFLNEFPVARRSTRFKCRLCGEKCCSLQPELFEDDLNRIRMVYPSFKPYYSPEGKFILIGEKGYCPFIKEGLCTIHGFKPVLCKIYPFQPIKKSLLDHFLRLPEDTEIVSYAREEYVFIFDEDCPGVGEGDPVDFQSILSMCLEADQSLKIFL